MASKDSNPAASLFSEEEMALEKVGSPVFTGASTGERLISQRPDLYRITVQLLGQGTGIREIKRLTGLHHRTIEAVMLREGLTIDTHRKELGARALKVAALGVERLEEIIAEGSIKPGELSMAVGILIDKGQVLTGGVTARVEKVEQAQVAAGLERMLDDLPVIDAELVDDAPRTNLSPENLEPIALPAPAADQPGDDRASDGQSDVLTVSNSVDVKADTSTAATKAPKSPSTKAGRAPGTKPSKEGGRGSRSSRRAPIAD